MFDSSPFKEVISKRKPGLADIENICDALAVVLGHGPVVVKTLSALFVVPLEMYRLKSLTDFLEERIETETKFFRYHTGGNEELVEWKTEDLKEERLKLETEWERLNEVKPSGEAEALLRTTILAISEMQTKVDELYRLLKDDMITDASATLKMLKAMVSWTVVDSNQAFLHFNNFLGGYLLAL